jgi:hypothetical protein
LVAAVANGCNDQMFVGSPASGDGLRGSSHRRTTSPIGSAAARWSLASGVQIGV